MNCTQRALRAITAGDLIRSGSTVVAAVSGGSDSMALAAILSELTGVLHFSLVIAHFNHGIRPRAAREAALVERYCKRCNLPLVLGSGDVPAESKRRRTGIEETARSLRYGFLTKAAREWHADAVALGHTRDDQVETILHHIIRGAGWRGITGIPVRRGIIIRPLLGCTRDELKLLLRRRHIRYAVDESNRDNTILRNRIRNRLLPGLRKSFNPSIDDAIIRLGENLSEGWEVLEHSIKRHLPPPESDGGVRIGSERLDTLSDFQLYLLVDLILRERFNIVQDVEKVHFDAAKRLIREGHSGGHVQLPQGITLYKDQRGIVISSTARSERKRKPRYEPVLLPGPGRFSLAAWGLHVEIAEIDAGPPASNPAGDEAYLAGVKFPIRVRSRLPGDRMVPFGMRGRKKLCDIYIDKKVPVHSRDGIPVFEDVNGILWVPGVVTDERARVLSHTRRITHIRISP
jgi:tRNA(Ile)-lysidine synthase